MEFMSTSTLSSRRAGFIRSISTPWISRRIRRRFGASSEEGRREITTLLRDVWQADGAIDAGVEKEDPEQMLRNLEERTDRNRRLVIPWLDAAQRLDGLRVLEIGCGTGCGTIPLAEQGAQVTALDVRDDSLQVTRARLKARNLSAELLRLNAEELTSRLADKTFDMVLFWASLEHMTIPERLTALRDGWSLLRPDGLLGLIDTPNRLWDFDAHASQLPFFHWLPLEIALPYAAQSPRPSCRALAEGNDETALCRYGGSMSFHELTLAVGSAETLDVVSGLDDYLRRRNLPRLLRWSLGRDRRYQKMLRRRRPKIHRAFFEENLQLLIRKP
jgi:2-polyprenyl-3-methyl-5-hydroxy-6-metoxy-1,4-benzoquinol methylase